MAWQMVLVHCELHSGNSCLKPAGFNMINIDNGYCFIVTSSVGHLSLTFNFLFFEGGSHLST